MERRILSLTDLEGGTLTQLHRASVKADLRMGRVLTHLSIADVSDDEIDAALDEQ